MTQALLLAVVTAMLLSGVAHAQDTGSLIRRAPAQIPTGSGSDAERARRATAAFAECLVDRSRGRVEKYLASFPGTAEARDIGRKLADSDCLSSGGLKFQEQVMRALFYQILYNKTFRDKELPDFSTVPPLDYSAGAPVGVASNEIALRNFADCVTRANPSDARTLTLSNTASDGEKRAFDAMMPSFSACLPQDRTIEFSKTILKGLVAETLYRLSTAAASPSATGSAI
ncbi:hypothetical protein FJQ54_08975 [Sandaracinobacter neustonicus]|uniref:Uncharacterized protein n=1 Tax=Sandaracinobacter neustonicus TaxID=1715348 RepID=A0A501XKE7_9SPHN|nr:hypothetical protein [Sandaracinobacter neustonicus]TPE61026.1 hypothetical protein FJQ54_08975 [Sandaracinobacter neustonicus]